MRRFLLGLMMVLGLAALATDARAQAPISNNGSDPFFTYYAFYLPRAQAQANGTSVENTINAISAQRQAYASTNRPSAFDTSDSGGGLFDPEGDFLGRGNRSRSGSATSRAARHGGNLNGRGPVSNGHGAAGFYGSSTGLKLAHPTLRPGIGRNANLSVVQGRGRSGGFSSGGYGGVGNAGNVGLPGPR